jgi:hypothetical protein
LCFLYEGLSARAILSHRILITFVPHQPAGVLPSWPFSPLQKAKLKKAPGEPHFFTAYRNVGGEEESNQPGKNEKRSGEQSPEKTL